jgi:integrase/recombinase XerD
VATGETPQDRQYKGAHRTVRAFTRRPTRAPRVARLPRRNISQLPFDFVQRDPVSGIHGMRAPITSLSRSPSGGRTSSSTYGSWSSAAPAMVSRRLSTVAGMFKYAIIDELVGSNPTLAVTRPRVPWEGQGRTVLHPLEFAAVLGAARQHGATAHALVALLGMLGLRVSEACNAQVTDLRYAGGYELVRVVGKGAKPAEIPVLRAVKTATEGRTHGPILCSAAGAALTRGAASRLLGRVVREACVTSPASPHTLRRTFCTAGLITGVPLRDKQYAMRHGDAQTTIRYDTLSANLR